MMLQMKVLETRVPPPVVALCFALLIWWAADYLPRIAFAPGLKAVMVSLLLVIGILFDLSGLAIFRRARTTINPVRPNKASALVQTGIYKVTRNPMYVGLVFVLGAWCLYLDSPLALIFVAGFILYITLFQIMPEERTLVELFGPEYREYQSRVRRWL